MEKRTILAIVLSIIILIVWQQVFILPRQKQLEEERARQEEVARQQQESTATGQAPVEQAQEITVPVQSMPPATDLTQRQLSAEAQDVIIETPLMHVIVTTQGARIRTWQIKAYKDSQGEYVDLITEDARQRVQFPLEVFTGDPSLDEELNMGLYETPEHTINLSSGQEPATIRFACMTSQGVEFIKALTFSPDSYKIDVTLTFNDLAQIEKAISIFWGPGLGTGLGGSDRWFEPGAVSKTTTAKLIRDKVKKIDGLVTHANIEWGAIEQKYFTAALIASNLNNTLILNKVPLQPQEGEKIDPSRQLIIGVSQPLLKEGNIHLSLYAGPKERSRLAEVYPGFERLIDYGFFGFIAEPLAIFMNYLYKYVKNYGVAIIILTILIKILFYPLTRKSFHSMKRMQELQPKVNALREKYKKDSQLLNQEMMKLYKQEGVNPMGGCFPMLLQLPVFFALYRTLSQSIELRGASFLWITDLSVPETLFFRPLVLMMGASMLLQQSMTPTTADNKQAQIFKFMPILFTVMFWNFPSGLVLYWLMNNVLTIGQQYLINKGGVKFSKTSESTDEETTSASRKRRKKGK